MQGEYLDLRLPRSGLPDGRHHPTGDTQVAVLSGNSTSFVVQQFDDSYRVGDRVLLAVYDATVREIPDFAIVPPVEITLPATTAVPVNGPNVRVTRNSEFSSTVTLGLVGDTAATAAGMPAMDILPAPSATPPAAGDMSAATFTPNVFAPNAAAAPT